MIAADPELSLVRHQHKPAGMPYNLLNIIILNKIRNLTHLINLDQISRFIICAVCFYDLMQLYLFLCKI